MLDLSMIDRDLTEPSASDLETTDERLAKVMSLTASDHFSEAAEAAQSLFEGGTYDLRILGPFLFGVYLERGMEIVPEILGSLVRMLSSSFAFWGPQNKKQLHADNMLKWLLATMLRDFRLHETGQDDTWKQWNSGSEFTISERQGLKLIPELHERIVNQLGNAKALPYLLQLESMLHKMELSAQSARPRVGRGRDDFLSVKLGGVEAATGEESSSESNASDENSSSEGSSESSSDESSSSDSSSAPSNSSSPSTSSNPSATSSSSSSPSSTSSSSSQGSGDDSDSNKSTPSSESSPSSDDNDAEKREEDEKRRAEESEREAKEREEAERAARDAEVAAVQAEESPAEAEPSGKGIRSISVPENEPFRLLRRKMAAFQKLVSAGEHQRAAIVAADLLQIMDHFDPRLYLPSLFRKFFRVLSLVGNDLTPHMTERTDLSYKALLQLYQVDLDYFVRSASSKKK